MPNQITTTYTFSGSDFPKFLEDWKKLKEGTLKPEGRRIAEYFNSSVPSSYNFRTYTEQEWVEENNIQIIMKDDEFPHYKIWNGALEKYRNLKMDINAIDRNNYKRGMVHTGYGVRYRALIQRDVNEFDTDLYGDLRFAREDLEDCPAYIIQQIWDNPDYFNNTLKIVTEKGDTKEIRKHFSL